MAAFSDDEIAENPGVWDLFQNGGVVLFKEREILKLAAGQLASCGYVVHLVDCQDHHDEESILKAIVNALGIARYPNMCLDGFNDFISQIEFSDWTGVIVVLLGFHRFRQACPESAFFILDIMADNHRSHLLLGNRLLTLVQSDDPRLDERIGKVGGYQPIWNSSEWFLESRGL